MFAWKRQRPIEPARVHVPENYVCDGKRIAELGCTSGYNPTTNEHELRDCRKVLIAVLDNRLIMQGAPPLWKLVIYVERGLYKPLYRVKAKSVELPEIG
jgi:hypothetical protein